MFTLVLTKYLVYLLQWHTPLRNTNLTVTSSIPLHRELLEFRSTYFIFFSKKRLFNETESPARKVLLFSVLTSIHLLIINPVATCLCPLWPSAQRPTSVRFSPTQSEPCFHLLFFKLEKKLPALLKIIFKKSSNSLLSGFNNSYEL